jgi:hypothetical protein
VENSEIIKRHHLSRTTADVRNQQQVLQVLLTVTTKAVGVGGHHHLTTGHQISKTPPPRSDPYSANVMKKVSAAQCSSSSIMRVTHNVLAAARSSSILRATHRPLLLPLCIG